MSTDIKSNFSIEKVICCRIEQGNCKVTVLSQLGLIGFICILQKALFANVKSVESQMAQSNSTVSCSYH